MKKKVLFSISLCSVLVLAGCVSEQSYVGSDKPVSDRTFDNIEAARTRISLGLNYLRRGDTSQAKYNLERARSFAPNSAEVYSALAYYYQNVGEPKQAESYFRQAISKDSNYADAYNNYGAFLCQLQRYDEAEQLLLKAISRPGYIRVAESYENLALCQLQQNNFNKAKSYLDNSIGHNTTRISSLTMAAALDYAMGDNRQAKAQLDRIQRLGRVSARTVLLSYLLAEKSGDRETMRNAEQLLLTLYTETPETRLLLQGKLQDSEFELLRERYKDSLMANIVVPDEKANTVDVPTAPQPNPKLKIVKRKTSDEPDVVVAAKPQTEVITTDSPVLTNATPAIANSLDTAKQIIVKPAEVVAALPAETVVTPEPVTEQASGSSEAMVQTTVVDAPVNPIDQDLAKEAPVAQLPSAADIEAYVAKSAGTDTDSSLSQQEQTDALIEETAREPVTNTGEQVSAESAVAVTSEAKADSSDFVDVEQAPTEPMPDSQTEEVSADEVVAEVEKSDSEQLPPTTAEQATAIETTPYHIVQASESLYSISVKHNIRLPRLMQWNQLAPDSVIKTGQKIWLGPVSAAELAEPIVSEPALKEREQIVATEPYHTVVAGETMFGISYKYNVRLSSFMQWNKLDESSKLHVGQKVFVVDPETISQ